jgi:hypothetical protein
MTADRHAADILRLLAVGCSNTIDPARSIKDVAGAATPHRRIKKRAT